MGNSTSAPPLPPRNPGCLCRRCRFDDAPPPLPPRNLWCSCRRCLFDDAPPPPMVLVPPLFDFPPIAARTRMLESSYDVLFGKLALKCLFEDYFEQAKQFSTRIMLKPIDDPHVDLIASVSGPLDHKPDEKIVGNAQFRWQSDVHDPHTDTFVDFLVSSADPALVVRSSAYFPKFGFGAFGVFPVLSKQRKSSNDYGIVGLRYGSSNLSIGASFVPFPEQADELPKNAWLVSKMGRLTAGVQYEPIFGSKDGARYKNLANWNCAVGYELGSGSPLWPSFNVGLELARSSQFIASFYQHLVVQRREWFHLSNAPTSEVYSEKRAYRSLKVKNPLEKNEIVGITNYIDFGFELQTRVDDNKPSNNIQDSSFQVAASWQANENFLIKGKVGSLSSSVALAFKSWWKPSFTVSVSAIRDRTKRETALGFGVHVDNIREGIYQRADPNYAMLTPSKEHLAEGIQWKVSQRPLFESDVNSGNFQGVPQELRPLNKMIMWCTGGLWPFASSPNKAGFFLNFSKEIKWNM